MHILLLEDSPLDAELTFSKMSEAGLRFTAVRVDTEEAFRSWLARPDLDLILSDYSLPTFTGLAALNIAKSTRPELPFIFISGALGEDNAVEMLKEGATDYVLKQKPERLVPSIRRAIAEAEDRAERKRAEELLRIERKRAEEEREALLASERAARAEAERASQMKDQFLATLSHELRTPLNAIVGWSQILKSGRITPEDLTEGIAVIERNARMQARIIEDLLDMSRITAGKLRLDFQWIDLADVIAAALESVRPTADAKDIRITSALDGSTGPVRGDPARLQQVFWNLLTNAIKFTPRGGVVQVSLWQIDSHVQITVSDTGSGIDAGFLPHIFDRFRQADASTTRNHGGLGIGLSIVKQIVEMHGGEVRASSDGLGKGSTFTVTMPVAISRLAKSANDNGHAGDPTLIDCEAPKLNGVRILIVDDEVDARNLVRRILEGWGAKMRVAASADEAVEILERETIDVLLTDIGMPGRDGYDLLREVRSRSGAGGGCVPAIALTAFAAPQDRERALKSGFDAHIAKPIDPTGLCNVISELAARGQLRK